MEGWDFFFSIPILASCKLRILQSLGVYGAYLSGCLFTWSASKNLGCSEMAVDDKRTMYNWSCGVIQITKHQEHLFMLQGYLGILCMQYTHTGTYMRTDTDIQIQTSSFPHGCHGNKQNFNAILGFLRKWKRSQLLTFTLRLFVWQRFYLQNLVPTHRGWHALKNESYVQNTRPKIWAATTFAPDST